ncbi:MAG TPA: carboxy terminal-processing peptidase [Chryseosolibacter sp.]|nr:carboxy terminal-processing peptidase [Chryseosolibacter sp.]
MAALIALWMISMPVVAQNYRNFRQEALHLQKILAEKHVSPRDLNDDFSRDVFDVVLDELDPEKIYFTSSDIAWLEPYQTRIDEEFRTDSWVFLGRLRERFESSARRARSNLEAIFAEEIVFNGKVQFNERPSQWENDEGSLKERQRLWIKSKVFERLALYAERDSTSCSQTLLQRRKDAIARVKKTELHKLDLVVSNAEQISNHVGAAFFHALTAVFDPHTLYLSPTELKNFIGRLGTDDYYFGFTLDQNPQGEITISALTPGGPAWKSGELHVSDILVSLQVPDQSYFDLTEMNIEEANLLLDEIDAHVIDFTVRKADGVKKTVRLKKEKMTAEENFVRSFVLEGEQMIGYIHLPDFYTKWGHASEGSRCANDVAREVIKLKKEGIEGLILDLRFNGGGSLYEALAMAGIFIDEGPLGIQRDRERIMTLKDVNRGTVYDGPLVVMVNGHSASASEFVAAAIQDYNRGLVVGSRTYGKATGQNIIPINPIATALSMEDAIDKSEGFVKITIERLYRVTGRSLQGQGLVPDIELPDVFDALNSHEQDQPFSLIRDSLVKNTFYRPLVPINRQALRGRSQERIAASQVFREIVAAAEKISEIERSAHQWSLGAEDFCAEVDQIQARRQFISSVRNVESPAFTVRNNSTEQARLLVDAYADEYNKRWFDKLQNDVYLHETYRILSDMLTLKNP